MKAKYYFTVLFSLLFILASCGGEAKEEKTEIPEGQEGNIEYMGRYELEEHIQKLEKDLYEDTMTMDRQKAEKLLAAYSTYADKNRDKDLSPEYTFKAGELAMGLNHSLDAVRFFSITYDRYVNYDKRPYALFLKAFVLENQINDFEQAKNTYEVFIEEYPDHPMRDDAEYSIQNMGKSPEELIKEFEAKQDSEEVS